MKEDEFGIVLLRVWASGGSWNERREVGRGGDLWRSAGAWQGKMGG
jgi:hypothetical protein